MKTLTQLLKDIADVLREKLGKEEAISPQKFEEEILNISFPTLAKSMSDSTGYGKNRIKTIIVDGSIEVIAENAFKSSKNTELYINEGVKYIRKNAFVQNTSLNTVVLPNTLKSLSESSFGECTSITKIVIPASVESIYAPFKGCTSLNEITVEGDNAKYSSRDKNIIFDEDTRTLVQGCKSSSIPEDTAIIGDYAFENIPIVELTIPDSVTAINQNALHNLYLTKITFEENANIKSLGLGCIVNTKITELTIPDSVTSLGAYCIQNNTELEQLYISKNVSTIPVMGFSYCSKLKTVTIPVDSILSKLENEAFSNCKSLEKLVIPGTLNEENKTMFRTIGSKAFYGNTNFKELDLSQLNAPPTLGTDAFSGCHSELKIKVKAGLKSIMVGMTNWADIDDERIEEVET